MASGQRPWREKAERRKQNHVPLGKRNRESKRLEYLKTLEPMESPLIVDFTFFGKGGEMIETIAVLSNAGSSERRLEWAAWRSIGETLNLYFRLFFSRDMNGILELLGGIPDRTFRWLRREKKMPVWRLGKSRYVYRPTELYAWLCNNNVNIPIEKIRMKKEVTLPLVVAKFKG